MKRKILSIGVLSLLLLPALALASVSVVQDSCVTFNQGGIVYNKTYFTVVNFNLPAPVCRIVFIPEPLPAPPQCVILGTEQPAGWTGNAPLPDGGATWFTGSNCILPGTDLHGFSFTTDPDFCCYLVQFYDPNGFFLAQQEECFIRCEHPVAVEPNSWGSVKSQYR
ncbi:MAG: hypothetical protein U0167_13565 [bacterium]